MTTHISELTQDGVVYLSADSFRQAGGVAHGFSTRYGGISQGIYASMNLGHARGDDLELVKENYRRFCGAIGANVQNLVFSQQIHTDNVRVCTTEDAGKGLYRPRDYEADGLVTDVPGLPLVIFSADCLPVLLYDPVRRVIGACHCGWRGTAMGIARKTVETLCRVYSSRPTDILAAIGPGISQCCFETHRDVPDAIRASLGEAAEETILPLPNDKFRVDLKAVNSIWLQRAGLPLENISVTEQCTCCQPEKFWTHRLVGQARGSMAAIIQLAE